MKFFSISAMLIIFVFLFSKAKPKGPIAFNLFSHVLSGKKMVIKKTRYTSEGLHFLILHDNENTGLEAAEVFCLANGGSITEILNKNERFVTFKWNKSSYAFDPNGIFENRGILKTLKKYSPSKITPFAIEQTRAFASKILEVYLSDNPGYIITLHNNTDENFDISFYTPTGSLKSVADSVYLNPEMDPDDFMLVTDTRFFSYLKGKNVNVVYQTPYTEIDGSLSVYAQQRGIPYLNVEVEHGHNQEHLRLISLAGDMFRENPEFKRPLPTDENIQVNTAAGN